MSAVVQASPSSQDAVLFAFTQPLAGLQESSVHTLPSSQLGADPPTQEPAAQVSVVVQASPSSQGEVLFAFTQPLAGLQESSVHTLPSSQLGADSSYTGTVRHRYPPSYRHLRRHRVTCCWHSHSRLQGYRSHPYTHCRHYSSGGDPLHRHRRHRYPPSYRHLRRYRVTCCWHLHNRLRGYKNRPYTHCRHHS